MDDMFLQCNKNAIYVLNSSYRYGEFDMINLFGSPAGRALNIKSPSIEHQQQPPYKCIPAIGNYPAMTNGLPTSTATANNSSLSSHIHSNGISYTKVIPSMTSIEGDLGGSPFNDMSNSLKCNSAIVNKTKKNSIFKSNIIAKKTKFWKFLEDDKLKKNSVEDLSTTSSGQSSTSRWRKNHKKSSTELYREAAQLLGLSCTLSDNCRCLDCQSRYFDCDDSDSYSDHSFMADTDFDLGFEIVPDQMQHFHDSNHHLHVHPNVTDEFRLTDDDGGNSSPRALEELSNSESLSDLSVDEEVDCGTIVT